MVTEFSGVKSQDELQLSKVWKPEMVPFLNGFITDFSKFAGKNNVQLTFLQFAEP